LHPDFTDKRLTALFPLYKARNYSKALSAEEKSTWQKFVQAQLLGGGVQSRLAKYFKRLEELSADEALDSQKRFLLEELQIYGQSIIPEDAL
jgi:exodeoxyribonuclease-1